MKKLILVFFFIFLTVPKANALDVGAYQDIKENGNDKDKLALDYYLKGLWQGYFWFHINHKFYGEKKEFSKTNPTIFCFPKSGKIEGMVEDFIEAEILYQKQNNELYEDDSIEIILSQYLNRTFPCK